MNYFGLQRLTEPLQITLFNLNFFIPPTAMHTIRITRQMRKDNKFRNTFAKFTN